MAHTSFAARRRSARSSSIFPVAIVCLGIFFLSSPWSSDSCIYWGQPSEVTEAPHSYGFNIDAMTQIKGDQQEVLQSFIEPHHTMQRLRFPLRIISFNIRYATETPTIGEEPWRVRCPKLCAQLRFIAAGQDSPFICLQEVLYAQLLDVQSHLGDSWSHIGIGRDGGNAGEFSPIFYRSDVWELAKTETRWLSKTPEVPSKGWDAALNRVVTMGEFVHRKSETHVVVLSTHFDHRGVKAREHSAELIIKFAQEWGYEMRERPSVVLIGGDFNSNVSDKAYQTIVAPQSGISDILDLLPRDKHHGNRLTYTGFDEENDVPSRIDFLFIQEPRTAKIESFGAMANLFDDGVRISDHRPLVADLEVLA